MYANMRQNAEFFFFCYVWKDYEIYNVIERILREE